MTNPTTTIEHVNLGPGNDIKVLERWDGSGYVVTHRNGTVVERETFTQLSHAMAWFNDRVDLYIPHPDECTCYDCQWWRGWHGINEIPF